MSKINKLKTETLLEKRRKLASPKDPIFTIQGIAGRRFYNSRTIFIGWHIFYFVYQLEYLDQLPLRRTLQQLLFN